MAIYNIDGIALSNAYNVDGTSVSEAFSIDDVEVFPDIPYIPNLTVMTYNVGQWYNGTMTTIPSALYDTFYALQTGIMNTYHPDVLGMQEYAGTFATGHSTTDVMSDYFTDFYANNETTWHRKAIFTNGYTMSDKYSGRYTNSDWGYSKAKITVEGNDVWVITTHISSASVSDRYTQAAELLNMVAELDRFIILGDMNTQCLSINDEDYLHIIKPFIDAGYNVANCNRYRGFNLTWGETPEPSGMIYALDNIITSSDIVIVDITVDHSKFPVCSANNVRIDHCPLIAHLAVL